MSTAAEGDGEGVGWRCEPPAAASTTCGAPGSRAIAVLAIGHRPFVQVTRPLVEEYAHRTGATLYWVDSTRHAALRRWSASAGSNPRFMKLPVVEHLLALHSQLLLLDDDVLLSPAMPDLFRTSCDAIGAVVERHKPQGWHAMHWRAACEIYGVPACAPSAWRLFNSGVMLLSQRHRPLVAGWQRRDLRCKILCDQLFFNAAAQRERACVHDLGQPFNYVGSELRRAVLAPNRSGGGSAAAAAAAAAARRASLRRACAVHLTRKVPKLYTAHWVARRSLRDGDVLACVDNASSPATPREMVRLMARLPNLEGKYRIEEVLQ